MLKHITCKTPKRFVRIAWVSLQPNGDISVGLSDRAYVAPRFQSRLFVWNAYNRQTIEFAVPSDPTGLDRVRNPHFTYHPPSWFHLKADRISKGEALFEAIGDMGIVLAQQTEAPWIRAISSPLRDLRSAGLKWQRVPTGDLPVNVTSEDISIQTAVDFIRPSAVGLDDDLTTWTFVWGSVGIRVRVSLTVPRVATLGWFHSH